MRDDTPKRFRIKQHARVGLATVAVEHGVVVEALAVVAVSVLGIARGMQLSNASERIAIKQAAHAHCSRPPNRHGG